MIALSLFKVIEMSVLDVYIHELKRSAAMAPCDHTLKQFVLQDVIIENGKLKV